MPNPMPDQTPAATPAPAPPKSAPCRHIFTDGHQCGSPALRGEAFCFYHHAGRRPQPHFRRFGELQLSLPMPEDLHAVQRSIGEVFRLLCTGEIEERRATAILTFLNGASTNLARLHRYNATLPPTVDTVVQHPTHGPIATSLTAETLSESIPASIPAPEPSAADDPFPDHHAPASRAFPIPAVLRETSPNPIPDLTPADWNPDRFAARYPTPDPDSSTHPHPAPAIAFPPAPTPILDTEEPPLVTGIPAPGATPTPEIMPDPILTAILAHGLPTEPVALFNYARAEIDIFNAGTYAQRQRPNPILTDGTPIHPAYLYDYALREYDIHTRVVARALADGTYVAPKRVRPSDQGKATLDLQAAAAPQLPRKVPGKSQTSPTRSPDFPRTSPNQLKTLGLPQIPAKSLPTHHPPKTV